MLSFPHHLKSRCFLISQFETEQNKRDSPFPPTKIHFKLSVGDKRESLVIELRGEQEGGKEELTLIKKRLETRFESISFRFSADESSSRHIDWLRLRGKQVKVFLTFSLFSNLRFVERHKFQFFRSRSCWNLMELSRTSS